MSVHIETTLPVGRESILEHFRESQPEVLTRSGHIRADCQDAVLQKANPKTMSAKFIIVTREKKSNLHNNKVQIVPSDHGQGLKLDLHKRAPVVLFEHGELPFPIGVSETPTDRQHTVKLSKDKAVAEVFFSQVVQEAAIIFRLVSEGTLRMASIGFLPEKLRQLDDDEIRVEQTQGKDVRSIIQGGGFDIVESLLLEWSITSTGADTGAFRQAISRGDVGGEKLTASLKSIFQRLAGTKTVWSPGTEFENTPLGKLANEPTEQDIAEAIQILPDRVFQKIESRVDSFVESLDEKIEKFIRRKTGILD